MVDAVGTIVTNNAAAGLAATNGVAVGLTTPTVPATGNSVVNKTALDAAAAGSISTNAPIQLATVSALKASSIVTNSGQLVALGGYTTTGDGGGGTFWYDAFDSTTPDDAFKTLVSTSGGRRYKRLLSHQVTPLMFGAKGDGTGDDSSALLRAILWCKTNAYTLDGLGRTYRLTNSVGARSSLSNLATDGYGSGMTMRNINFLQAATNTPILVWDLSTSTNLVAGDGGWGFQNLSFNWVTKPAAGDTESAAFYLSAPAIVSGSRDYSFICNSYLRDIVFGQGHTGFLIKGKGNFWGNKCHNLSWYQGWSGPGIDFSAMGTYQAGAPGNTFDGLYANVSGFTSTSQNTFLDLGIQQEGSIRNVEFNSGVNAIKQYITASQARNTTIRTIRLEGGIWSPAYSGFISLPNPQSGVVVDGLSLNNLDISGNGYFVRLPAVGPATDTRLHGFVFDTCRLTSANLYGVGGSGNTGEIAPVQALNPTLTGSTWGHITPDGTALTFGIIRSSRLWTSANRGDADVTLVSGTDAGIQMFNTTLTTNRTVTLSTTGVANGDEFSIVRTGGGLYPLNVGGLFSFAPSQTGAVRVRYVETGSYAGSWVMVNDARNPAPAISLATTSKAEDYTLQFDGTTANSRAWWPLGTSTSMASSPLTVLAEVGSTGTAADAANRGIWTFSSGNNAYSASSLSMYRATNALCIELTGATPGTDFRRIYVQGLFINMPSRELPIAVTWDRTNAPVVYVDGNVVATTETTGGTAPAWTNTIATAYFNLGVLAATDLWNNRLQARVINTVMSPTEIAAWASTGRSPLAAARPANVSIYASNFSSGVDGWVAPNGTDTLTGAVTTSPYTTSTMRFVAGAFSGSHQAARYSVFTPGRRYRVSGRIQMASGNVTMVGFVVKTEANYAQLATIPPLSAWYDFSLDFVSSGASLYIGGANAAGSETFTGNGTDNFVLYGLRIAEVGSLFSPTIMAGTSVPDKSGNGITGTLVGGVLPFTGSGYDGSSAIPATAIPAFTGGQVTNAAGSAVLSLNTTNANVGTFGSATQSGQFVVNTNGLITAATNITVTPAITNVTGLGGGVGTLLAGTASGTGGPAGTTSPSLTTPTFLSGATLGNGGGNPILLINGAAAGVKGFDIQSGGVYRWRIATSGSETGANAGSYLQFAGYSDAGAVLSTPMAITRDGTIYMKAGAAASAATYFPVFLGNPAIGQTLIESRTAAQVRSDIGAVSSTSAVIGANGVAVTRLRHGRTSAMVAGTTTVADSYVTASTRIILTVYTPGGIRGFLDTGTRTASTSFTITSSSALETSVVDWVAFEP